MRTGSRHFGHLTYAVEDIYAACQRLKDKRQLSIVRQEMAGWRLYARQAIALLSLNAAWQVIIDNDTELFAVLLRGYGL